MAKRLIISRKAYFDIERITEFNNTRNQSDTYSKKFVKNLFKVFKVLIRQPTLGIRTNIDVLLLLIWDDYYIFYSIEENDLIIRTIYHQSEEVEY